MKVLYANLSKTSEGIDANDLKGLDTLLGEQIYWPLVSAESLPAVEGGKIRRASIGTVREHGQLRPCLVADDGDDDTALVLWNVPLDNFLRHVSKEKFQPNCPIQSSQCRIAQVCDGAQGILYALRPGGTVTASRLKDSNNSQEMLLLATMRWDGHTLSINRTDAES